MAMLDPLFMDIQEVYSGDEFGLPYRDIIGEGVVAPTDGALEVTAGAGNSVDVAEGACWVQGDTLPARQPTYRCYNDATANVGISPDPSNPRKVAIIVQVEDAAFDGSLRSAELQAEHGAAAASPAEPTIPDSALVLAMITVPAGAPDSSVYTIEDRRDEASIGGGNIPLAAGGAGVVEVLRKTTSKVVSSTATLTDLLNGECTIPADAMGLDKVLKARLFCDHLQNNGSPASAPRLQISLGGTVILDMTPTGVGIAANANRRYFEVNFEIMNLGAHDQQSLKGRYDCEMSAPAATVGFADNVQGGNAYDMAFANRFSIATNVDRLLEVKVVPQTNSANCEVRLNGALITIE